MALFTITEVTLDGTRVHVGDRVTFRYRDKPLGGEVAWFNAPPSGGLWLAFGGPCHPSFPFQNEARVFACRVIEIQGLRVEPDEGESRASADYPLLVGPRARRGGCAVTGYCNGGHVEGPRRRRSSSSSLSASCRRSATSIHLPSFARASLGSTSSPNARISAPSSKSCSRSSRGLMPHAGVQGDQQIHVASCYGRC